VTAGSGDDRRPLLLGADDVARVFDLDTGLASQREAFNRLGRDEVDQPARLMLPVPRDGSLAFCYAARIAPGSGAVSKFGSVNPGNAAAGLPTVSATVLVLDPEDGRLVAIIEGTTLTALRTSAASALAASLLARPGAATAAVLSPGVQGRGHVRAFAHTLPLEEIRLWGRDPQAAERAAALDREVRPRVLAAATVAEAVAGADVVATCMGSHTPLVEAEQLAPGATVISIGLIAPDRSEVGLSVVTTAGTVAVDYPPAALEHAGPVIQALAAGRLRGADLVEGHGPAVDLGGDAHPEHLVEGALGDQQRGAVAARQHAEPLALEVVGDLAEPGAGVDRCRAGEDRLVQGVGEAALQARVEPGQPQHLLTGTAGRVERAVQADRASTDAAWVGRDAVARWMPVSAPPTGS
jgi:ornithine cyclodeaminase